MVEAMKNVFTDKDTIAGFKSGGKDDKEEKDQDGPWFGRKGVC